LTNKLPQVVLAICWKGYNILKPQLSIFLSFSQIALKTNLNIVMLIYMCILVVHKNFMQFHIYQILVNGVGLMNWPHLIVPNKLIIILGKSHGHSIIVGKIFASINVQATSLVKRNIFLITNETCNYFCGGFHKCWAQVKFCN
jgi:hypothetical protein